MYWATEVYNVGCHFWFYSRVLYKQCYRQGDYGEANIDFEPLQLFELSASNEGAEVLAAYDALHSLIVAGGNVANAYLWKARLHRKH